MVYSVTTPTKIALKQAIIARARAKTVERNLCKFPYEKLLKRTFYSSLVVQTRARVTSSRLDGLTGMQQQNLHTKNVRHESLIGSIE